MPKDRVLLVAMIAAFAAPWLAACSSGISASSIEAREPKQLHSAATASDLVACLKNRLGDDANVVAYPEPGKVDIRVGRASDTDQRYFHLVSLRRTQQGTDVEIRSADEWHPMMSTGRITGMVEDCGKAKAR